MSGKHHHEPRAQCYNMPSPEPCSARCCQNHSCTQTALAIRLGLLYIVLIVLLPTAEAAYSRRQGAGEEVECQKGGTLTRLGIGRSGSRSATRRLRGGGGSRSGASRSEGRAGAAAGGAAAAAGASPAAGGPPDAPADHAAGGGAGGSTSPAF
jgi:hypothetical protein